MNKSVASILFLSACQLYDSAGTNIETILEVPAVENSRLDLVIQLDDSPSNPSESFAAAIAPFSDALANFDLHVGVVTSDMGAWTEAGVASAIGGGGTGSCADSGKDGKWFGTGFTSAIDASNLAVGAYGCGIEQPLRATVRALDRGANDGFLRSDANLAIVMVANEDDCSLRSREMIGPQSDEMGPLESYRCTRFGVRCKEGNPDHPGVFTDCHADETSEHVTHVEDLVATVRDRTPGRPITVGSFAGPSVDGGLIVDMVPPPGQTVPQRHAAISCSFAATPGPTDEQPAIRLAAFANSFPNSAAYSGCDALAPSLADLAARIHMNAGDGCLPQALEHPEDCDVFDVSGGVETAVEASFVVDANCKLAAHQRVIVDRHGTIPPIGTTIRVRCMMAP